MKITYYGHSCFLVEEKDSRILFDPYENVQMQYIVLMSMLIIMQHILFIQKTKNHFQKNGLLFHMIIMMEKNVA